MREKNTGLAWKANQNIVALWGMAYMLSPLISLLNPVKCTPSYVTKYAAERVEGDVMKAFEIKYTIFSAPVLPAVRVCIVLNEIPAFEATFKYNWLHGIEYTFTSFVR